MNTPSLARRHFVASMVLAALPAAFSLPARSEAGVSLDVWKDPTCGCCKEWVAHLRSAGFTVTVYDSGNAAARAKAGIAPRYASCHTALVNGYAIEGHVPSREIQRLLRERPDVIGLAVPGMVKGSPGMEQGGIVEPYAVLLLHRNGGSSTYAKYRA
jgi:hypothetical protein